MSELGVRLNQLDWIATYAAIVATIVLIWNIFKWKVSGPKVAVECAPIAEEPSSEFTRRFSTQIAVKVTNKGDQPTLVTDIEYHVYHNWWAKFRQQPYGRIAVNLGGRDVLPWKLEPGEVWVGVGPEPPMHLKEHARLYVVVRVTSSRKSPLPASLQNSDLNLLMRFNQPTGYPSRGAASRRSPRTSGSLTRITTALCTRTRLPFPRTIPTTAEVLAGFSTRAAQ